jgi:Fur family iron response transcriptional regulator|tara:strand:+ start:140 stop:562 length:423 start_codon:yes stop_codon:yes gene_type:complete
MNKNLKIVNKLRSSYLRPTKQRIQIAKFLFDREKTFHFTVEQLDKMINSKNEGEKISLATFYNTVHAFKKAGHLKEILTSNNKHYFDTHIGPHYHFFDEKNNELTDINPGEIKIKNIPNAPKGKSIKDVDVVINIENDSH